MKKIYINLATWFVVAIGAGVILFDWTPWCAIKPVQTPTINYILREINREVGKQINYNKSFIDTMVRPYVEDMFEGRCTFTYLRTLFWKSQRSPEQNRSYRILLSEIDRATKTACEGDICHIDMSLNGG